MKIATWNLEWARPGSTRERIIRESLLATDADVICLTEAYPETVSGQGHVIEAALGNFVADRKAAKKVLLWARNGWRDVSTEGQFTPLGRIVSGSTNTAYGPMRIVGVCIPWHGSNTPRFGGDRQLWDDHMDFLKSLAVRLGRVSESTVLIGDYNQRLPRGRQPERVCEALEHALTGFYVATRNFVGGDGDLAIDHIAHTPDLRMRNLAELPKHQGGLRLSDHFGVMGEISPA